jgi:hypothetical protein
MPDRQWLLMRSDFEDGFPLKPAEANILHAGAQGPRVIQLEAKHLGWFFIPHASHRQGREHAFSFMSFAARGDRGLFFASGWSALWRHFCSL